MPRMFGPDLAVRGRRVVTPKGTLERCVHVSGGRIARVAPYEDVPDGVELVDAGDLVVLPGLVDTHVHVNEPGRTEWEGFATATRAAAAGGVTTIVDMPLNSIPPTTSPEALEMKRSAADGAVHVDVGFWGGAVPENLGHLRELHEAGVFGFKCFLCPSGVDEFPSLDLEQLHAAMVEIAAFDGLLLVHAEVPEPIERATEALADADAREYATYLASRPSEAEELAVAAVIEATRMTGCRAHVLHLSAASALEQIAADRSRVTAETCPHYLTLTAEEVERGATEFKCAPPIRGAENRDRLWAGLRSGWLSAVVSDHSPCTPGLKAGSFLDAWGGIASVQLGLRAVWTEARRRGFTIDSIPWWMSAGPARVAGLAQKGAIAEGKDADLVLFDPDHTAAVDPAELQHRHPITPYAGRRLDGRIVATYVRGVEVYSDGAFRDEPMGRLLRRGSV
ncbi:MAG: allantoinase AllB [Actinobacteria bacterium]|nr:allantoinase AllB [Actinomycetota bacterium]